MLPRGWLWFCQQHKEFPIGLSSNFFFPQTDALLQELIFITGNDQLALDDMPGSPLDPSDFSR